MKFEKRQGILYRIRRRIGGLGETWKQIIVPKSLRIRVMEVAHDSIFGGHLGVKKTKDRIQTNFYWPRMHNDVSKFCRSCDVCQKTVDKGTVARALLGEMPLIDTPFKRVAVDLVGPITPASERGHRYILTLVDYATRYPEAVPLKNIDTETAAEAMLDMYSRLGIPEEVLSDQGTQFVSSCMQEVSRLLSINRRTMTPYHRICNGLVERFNGTLKKMLQRLCSEQPRQWHRFINPLLFAYREASQEATGFSPFELLYGRTVRGPVQILKKLWTKETDVLEVKTSYQYVLELRERPDDTMKIAQEELKRSQSKNKRLYDGGAKRRAFQVGDKVLILLPTDNNKLLLQWRGPFVVERCGNGNNYGVEVNKRIKTYHANMLKPYFERKSDVDSFGDTTTEPEETKTIQASVDIAGNQAGSNAEVHETDSYDDKPSVGEEELLELGGHDQKETLRDEKLGLGLTNSREENVWQVLGAYNSVFTDVLGKSNVIQLQITLTESTLIRSKLYPLPYAIRENLKNKIQEMLDLGIIRTSASPYASPIVIVKKKDISNRI